MDSHNSDGDIYLDVATVPNDMSGAGSPQGQYDPDRVYTKLHDETVPLYGTGTQGEQIRGYGNYSNNAATWNGFCDKQSLQNPVDNKKKPYLAMRYWDDPQPEPAFEEDRRYSITITADDNVGPTVSADDGTVYYPIRHLSYVFYYHPTATSVSEIGLNSEYTGDAEAVRTSVTDAIRNEGFREVNRGAVIDLDINADDSEWTREPSQTFEYKFKSPGIWIVRVDTIDRSNNGRVMLVPVGVGDVNMRTRNIETRHRKLD